MSTPPPPSGGDDNPYNYDPQSGGGSSEGQAGDQEYGESSQQGHGDSSQQGYGQYGQAPSGYSGGYQAAPNYSGGQAPNTVDNNFGVIALVTGILGLVVCQPVGIAAIIYGRKAQAAERAGRADNATLGVVGFWLGVVAVALAVIALLFLVLIFAGAIAGGTFSAST